MLMAAPKCGLQLQNRLAHAQRQWMQTLQKARLRHEEPSAWVRLQLVPWPQRHQTHRHAGLKQQVLLLHQCRSHLWHLQWMLPLLSAHL